jgi:hypothetical protein
MIPWTLVSNDRAAREKQMPPARGFRSETATVKHETPGKVKHTTKVDSTQVPVNVMVTRPGLLPNLSKGSAQTVGSAIDAEQQRL